MNKLKKHKSMKHSLTFILALCCHLMCGAQATSLTIDNQTPGWLSSKINYGDQLTVKNLTLTGYLNATDLVFIGSMMQKHQLQNIDLTDANIVGDETHEDNDISYKNIFGIKEKTHVNRLALPKSINIPVINNNETSLGLEIDTLIYGSEHCSVYNNALYGYTYSGGGGARGVPAHLILREGVTEVADYACDNRKSSNNGKLESITLPKSIKIIGERAFYNCTSLKYVELPDGIEQIQDNAFQETSFMPDTLKLPNSLKAYYTTSFSKKNGQVVYIPSSVSDIYNTYGTYNNTTNTWTTYDYIDLNSDYVFIIDRDTPPSFKYHYEGCLKKSVIYVPKESVPLYENKAPYSKAIIMTIPVHVEGLILDKDQLEINVGQYAYISAEILPADADNIGIKWSTSNDDIVKVDTTGDLLGVSGGKATITATSVENPNIYACCEVTVHQPLQSITLTPKDASIKVGEIFKDLTVAYYPESSDNKNVKWASSNEEIATVDEIGIVTAISPGKVRITVTSEENSAISDYCEISVIQPATGITLEKTELEIEEDESIKLQATVLPTNASNQGVNWTSSDVSIAMVSPDGTIYAIKSGKATIMATTVDGGYAALCKVTVKPKTVIATALNLSTQSSSIKVGETLQLTATLSPDNVSNKTIDWSSTDENIATVDASGLVKALAEGKAKIIATTTDGSNLSAECNIEVEGDAGVESILADNKANVRIYNITGCLVYEGTYSDAKLKPGIYVVYSQGKVAKVMIGKSQNIK